MSTSKKNIIFFHPDLGIGGAERLVIDAAVGLQNLGHKVTIFTSYCDPAHCFDEARDGTLDVRVRGNTLIPPSIYGRFSILCAILRQLHLVLQISLFTSELSSLQPHIFFVDQLSACIPLLRVLYPKTRILFYCHFPDKLLAQKERGVLGWLKNLYRMPFDWLESWSTGCSDEIVVNSKFTREVFGKAFPGLRYRVPEVVYPCVDAKEKEEQDGVDGLERPLWEGKKVILSINRFERKKDVGLAIRAYAGLSETERKGTRLVIAGGYDPCVAENVSYHKELLALADSLKLSRATAKNLITALAVPSDISVLFLLSVPNSLKANLLRTASLLVYTPRNEHFGIVPLEAMQAGVPVLATNTGGPTETVIHGITGWLQDPDHVKEWIAVLRKVLHGMDEASLERMGHMGRERVRQKFSGESMAARLDDVISRMLKADRKPIIEPSNILVAVIVFVAAIAVLLAFVLGRA